MDLVDRIKSYEPLFNEWKIDEFLTKQNGISFFKVSKITNELEKGYLKVVTIYPNFDNENYFLNLNSFLTLLSNQNKVVNSLNSQYNDIIKELNSDDEFHHYIKNDDKIVGMEIYFLIKASNKPQSLDCLFEIASQYCKTYEHVDKGIKYFKELALQGYTKAMCKLGNYYFYRDTDQAEYWYDMAAKHGDTKGYLGLIEIYNPDIPSLEYKKDLEKAYDCYEQAVKLGDQSAIYEFDNFINGKGKNIHYRKQTEKINKIYENGLKCLEEKNDIQAFEYFKEAANQNHYKAKMQLGECYEKGIGCKKDIEKAIYWYEQSTGGWLKDAEYKLGCLYENVHNYEKALYWYDLAAESKMEAQLKASQWYEKGIGCKPNINNAYRFYVELAKRGNTDAQCWLGDINLKNGKYRHIVALHWYQKALEKKHPKAYLGMAKLHMIGVEDYDEQEIVLQKDLKTAFLYLEKSASKECAEANYLLGYCLEFGILKEKNIIKAVGCYQKAAKNNYREACFRLAECYYLGKGTRKDIKLAVENYQKAANLGHIPSTHCLALCYELGKGVSQNYEEALRLYLKSAMAGYIPSQFNYAYLILNGLGTMKNEEEAFYWFEQAANNNDAVAKCYLAYLYEKGIGCQKDLFMTFKYCEESAKQGCPLAQCYLGYLYINEIGCQKNLDQALFWYEQAVSQEGELISTRLISLDKTCCNIDIKQIFEYYDMKIKTNYPKPLGYYHETKIKRDINNAYFWNQQNADETNHITQYYLGAYYELGINGPKDIHKAIEHYKESAKTYSKARKALKRLIK